MKKRVKKLWVNSMTNDEYDQCRERLADGDSRTSAFCPLGILTNLCALDKGVAFEDVLVDFRGDEYCCDDLSPVVMEWAGLDEDNPKLQYQGEPRCISALNDNVRLSFVEIAELVEEQL